MHLSDFDYPLDDSLIATRPATPRGSARLLVSHPGGIEDRRVADLPDALRPGDLLVVNDTRVIPARLEGHRRRGDAVAHVEATLLAEIEPGLWRALVKPLRKLKAGETIAFDGLSAAFDSAEDGQAILRFDRTGDAFRAALDAAGRMPLPPYIEALRPADEADRSDYQTIFAARDGAVAAPTASLHFDATLMAALAARGIGTATVTLHVGAGTFLPVKVDAIADHRMHAEWGEVPGPTVAAIAAARAAGGRVIAVGTTALRILETAAAPGQLAPWSGETSIFITPGFPFRAVDGLVTNFHLPRSTLLMLVAAFVGMDRMRAIYAHAMATRYRVFSYGDASLLWPDPAARG